VWLLLPLKKLTGAAALNCAVAQVSGVSSLRAPAGTWPVLVSTLNFVGNLIYAELLHRALLDLDVYETTGPSPVGAFLVAKAIREGDSANSCGFIPIGAVGWRFSGQQNHSYVKNDLFPGWVVTVNGNCQRDGNRAGTKIGWVSSEEKIGSPAWLFIEVNNYKKIGQINRVPPGNKKRNRKD